MDITNEVETVETTEIPDNVTESANNANLVVSLEDTLSTDADVSTEGENGGTTVESAFAENKQTPLDAYAQVKSRVFSISTDIVHPETGETIITQDKLDFVLSHKTIKYYAYVIHDKDVYTALDEQVNPAHKAGTKKAAHIHCVLRTGSNQLPVGTIAKWFDIPVNFIKAPKGAGAFLDCVEYLTHERDSEQQKGKYLYQDSELTANFDFRSELNKRSRDRDKYGRDVSTKERFRYDVLVDGRPLQDCEKEDAIAYADDISKLEKLSGNHMDKLPAPTTRINVYVEGPGRIGKGLFSRALARSLFPDLENDDEIFHNTGSEKAAFEGYSGQPVIIWNDRRAFDLINELGSRENVFNIFDSHPAKQRQNVKYSSVNLINKVNIVNSVQPYDEFLNGLVGEYTDKNGNSYQAEENEKNQSYGRFPVIVRLREGYYDFYVNRGFAENTREFQSYIKYEHIKGDMRQIVTRCGTNIPLTREIEAATVKPVVEKINELLNKIQVPGDDEDAIRAEFAGNGKQCGRLNKLYDTDEVYTVERAIIPIYPPYVPFEKRRAEKRNALPLDIIQMKKDADFEAETRRTYEAKVSDPKERSFLEYEGIYNYESYYKSEYELAYGKADIVICTLSNLDTFLTTGELPAPPKDNEVWTESDEQLEICIRSRLIDGKTGEKDDVPF